MGIHQIATPAGELSVNKLSNTLQRSFENVSEYLSILEEAGLVRFLFPQKSGKSQLRNPIKIYPENTNIIANLALPSFSDNTLGKIRETFFVTHLQNAGHTIYYSHEGDFVTEQATFEIGGKNKTTKQIKQLDEAYVVSDGILVGDKKTIPLYLFGMLY